MIPHYRLVLTDADKAAANRVLDSGHIGQGPEVEAFERELAEAFRPDGAAVCVSSGTAALALAMMHTGGGSLWISTYTCAAVWHAARLAGKSVRLSDIDPVTLHPLRRDVSEHTYGVLDTRPALIEDFTHAPLRPAGTRGVLSVISFGPTKPLAAGAGGAVLGPRSMIENIRDRRDYDEKPDMRDRFNWQMSDLHAAIGRERLARLRVITEWRNAVASVYRGDKLARLDRFWYRYTVEDPRAVAIPHLAGLGIQAIGPLEPWELLHRKLERRAARYPNAERAASSLVSVPIWPGMSMADVDTVAEALRDLRKEAA